MPFRSMLDDEAVFTRWRRRTGQPTWTSSKTASDEPSASAMSAKMSDGSGQPAGAPRPAAPGGDRDDSDGSTRRQRVLEMATAAGSYENEDGSAAVKRQERQAAAKTVVARVDGQRALPPVRRTASARLRGRARGPRSRSAGARRLSETTMFRAVVGTRTRAAVSSLTLV